MATRCPTTHSVGPHLGQHWPHERLRTHQDHEADLALSQVKLEAKFPADGITILQEAQMLLRGMAAIDLQSQAEPP